MQTHSRAHHSYPTHHWNPANVAITILATLLFLVFLFLFLLLTATPVHGQNHVPQTAAEAAKMPQYASRLAHPMRMGKPDNASRAATPPRATYRNPNDPRAYYRGGPLDSVPIYTNGPTNGTVTAWTINFGQIVSDSFTLTQQNSAKGMNFAAWLFPGDVLQTAEVSITSSEFGGTTYFDGVVTFTASNCTTNEFGFSICIESGAFPDVPLNAGTFWVNLQNAVVNTGDPVYWDENSGASLASQNSVGTIPSESFTILGGSTTTTWSYGDNYACPPPQEGFHDLHDLPVSAAFSGVAIDEAGSLYGAMAGGANNQGMLYRLTHGVTNWFFTSLYSFLGGDNGGYPNHTMLGPDGALYGSASGGIQRCGSDGTSYCGVIFKANPRSTPCPSVSCRWNETTLYQFTGNDDAWGGTVSAFDAAGNLYGISTSGGIYGQGAIFELSPGSGGWTEKVLYSFVGTSDGASPSSLLVGHDGHLYGTASSGGEYNGIYGYGVIFRLIPSGASWTQTVLYTFTNNGPNDGYSPGGLVQDREGNLYGFSICHNEDQFTCGMGWLYDWYGLLFELRPQGANTWRFGVFYSSVDNCNGYLNTYHQLAFDSTGVLYAAQGGADFWCAFNGCYTYYCGQIGPAGAGYSVQGNADIFTNLSVDRNGHLYGTTQTCGGMGTPYRTKGMIWEYSP